MLPKYCEEIFNVVNSDRNYEEYVQINNMGLAPAKPEGSSTTYDEVSQGYTTRGTNVSYSKGFIISREARDDDRYFDVMKRGIYALGLAAYQTTETLAANVFNNGFTVANGGDGQPLFSTVHPTTNGTQSNELAVAADFSEASVEDLSIQIRKAQDDVGNQISLTTDLLFGAPDLVFEFERLLKSQLQTGTANNDINAIRNMTIFPKGFVTNPFLTDADAFFMRTTGSAAEGLIYQKRAPLEFSKDNDFDTDNEKYKIFFREVFLFDDWRAVYGSPGA
jgi:phage major head subunit gpT-like protein